MFKCKICKANFTRKTTLKNHFKRKHEEKRKNQSSKPDCPFCGLKLKSTKILRKHIKTVHKDVLVFKKKICVLNNKLCIFRKELRAESKTLADFCISKKFIKEILTLLKSETSTRIVFKFSIVICANYQLSNFKEDQEENQERNDDEDSFNFRSKSLVVNHFESDNDIKRKIRKLLQGIINREEDLLTRGSGWRFLNLQCCDVIIYDTVYIAEKINKKVTKIKTKLISESEVKKN